MSQDSVFQEKMTSKATYAAKLAAIKRKVQEFFDSLSDEERQIFYLDLETWRGLRNFRDMVNPDNDDHSQDYDDDPVSDPWD